jgi:hypothetical protein
VPVVWTALTPSSTGASNPHHCRDKGLEGFQEDYSAHVGWARDEDKVEVGGGGAVVCPAPTPSGTGASNPRQ